MRVVVHPHIEQITNDKGTVVYGTRQQFPFTVAYATTVHKVQGLTIDGPVGIDYAAMYTPGQGYTSLSRTTKIEYINIINLPRLRPTGGLDGAKASVEALEFCRKIGIL